LDKTSSGPGTTVIEVLARQFDACVEVLRNFLGTSSVASNCGRQSRRDSSINQDEKVLLLGRRWTGSSRLTRMLSLICFACLLTTGTLWAMALIFHPRHKSACGRQLNGIVRAQAQYLLGKCRHCESTLH